MRILFVNHTSAVSGGERSLLGLLSALPHSVQARLAAPPGDLLVRAGELGIPVSEITGTAGSLRLHPLHTPRALAEMALAGRQVRRLAADWQADVVHANSIRAGLVLALGRPAGAGLVHVRDCLPPGALSTATLRIIAGGRRTIVANSRYTAGSVLRAAPGARVEVVHNAVDLARWDPALIDRAAARARLGEAGTRAVLLGVVAQLSPWKGQETAIDALRLLLEQGVDAQLLLIGSAKFLARATRFDNEAYVAGLRRRIADAGIEERVTWMGEREDVPELVRALDVLMLPSVEEPFGRAVIEAMAMGVPVLATSVGGPAEIITDGREGYLLAPGDPARWAAAARLIVEAPDGGRSMGSRGRARALEEFSLGRHVGRMMDVYASAALRVTA